MRQADERQRCSYVVVFEGTDGAGTLRDFADSLTSMSAAGCETIVLDCSEGETFEAHRRVLRWVARHVAIRPEHLSPSGSVDPIRAAALVSCCEKVIVAGADVRYTDESIARVCELLDRHEVVEPQDYLDPLPWWSGIEAGRILVNRALDPQPDHGTTFGFRRSVVNGLPSLGAGDVTGDQIRRLESAGVEVYAPAQVFVKREPSTLADWVAERPAQAGHDFALPVRSAFFFSLLPLLAALAFFGGFQLAGGFALAIALGSVAFAIRGRFEASRYFPLRATLFAPLWVFERSVSVWWALSLRLRGAGAGEPGEATAAAEHRGRGVAKRSGEAG